MKSESWPEPRATIASEGPPLNSETQQLSLDSHLMDGPIDHFPVNYGGRRRKAAIVLTVIWGTTIILHLVSWGYWLVWGLTGLLFIHGVRIITARIEPTPSPLSDQDRDQWPYVSLLVAAKNEEAVIGNLVRSIGKLDYPRERYELWVIDDNSSDRTPQILQQLALEYPQLKIFRRDALATGGKSGALNQVLPLAEGEFLAVFDADAHVTPDLLRQVLPLFNKERVGAVQVRKAISNETENWLTMGQSSEMALDAFFQQKRIAVGGLGELRGNGQFMRRSALDDCGGWNEETITDDLDLTIRLHLKNWDIDFLQEPPVGEEGVTTVKSLWHQRNRWAEGGYQRYLDYWPLILKNRMGWRKSIDLLGFLIIQYLLPVAAVPDFLMAGLLRRMPIASPIATLTISISLWGMFMGLSWKERSQRIIPLTPLTKGIWSLSNVFLRLLKSIRGTIYMCHWFIVIGSTNVRISVMPKRLKWVKTEHRGAAM